ncbi:MAG: glycosyltransferase [Planctomycetota bacterium]|nr:glycosyltransferase [Planctomycetota bacterium]
MRIALVSHGLPPRDRTGVEIHSLDLARALVSAGHQVEVFAPQREPELPHLALRREVRAGLGITRLITNVDPADPAELQELPGVAQAFAVFLERVSPDVVHFQHLARLGLSLIDEARQRHIPTVYTAHDFYPANAWYTGLKPDLTPLELADSKATADCDLARAFLSRAGVAGDSHLGVLESELMPEQWAALTALLAGDAGAAGFSEDEVKLARDRRMELDQRRRAAFAAVDLLLAPTEYLAERLHAAGVGALPPKVVPCGIDTEILDEVPAPSFTDKGTADNPLRCGYLGALVKHKGVDVLLEAFDGLAGASLAIFGMAHDPTYQRKLVERADGERVRFMGAYRPQQVAQALAQFDLLIVPSIWPENAPFVIREAFAAGRPVIASAVGALGESVRDGVDGQLVPAGDADALRAALEACVADPTRVANWATEIAPVRTLAEQVGDLEEWYARLVEVKEPRTTCADGAGEAGEDVLGEVDSTRAMPAHVRSFSVRVAELEALTVDELLERACGGLDKLAQGCDLPCGDAAWLAALASGSSLADRVREGGRSAGWLRSVFSDQESARESLAERASWRESQAQAEHERAHWLEQTLADKERALAAEADLRAEAERACRSLEEEKGWLADVAEDQGRAGEWLQGTLAESAEERDWLKGQWADAQVERDWLKGQFADAQEERDWLREQVTSALGERDWLKDQLAAARREGAWLKDRGQVDGERLVWLEQSLKERQAESRWLAESLDGAREELTWVQGRLDEVASTGETIADDRDRAQAALEAVKQESVWLGGVLEHRVKEIEWLRGSFAALQESGRESEEEHTDERRQWEANLTRLLEDAENLNKELKELNGEREALNGELLALRNHELWVRDELTGLARQVTWAAAPGEVEMDGEVEVESQASVGGHVPPAQIAGRVDRAHRVLRALEEELRWRRGEMEQAQAVADSWTSRGLSGELRSRVRSWQAADQEGADDGGGGDGGVDHGGVGAPEAEDAEMQDDQPRPAAGSDDPFGEGGC